jgi:hypothetical protein
MDPRLVQRSRYLLQARVRRAKSCPPSLFANSCSHLLEWLRGHPLIAPIVAELARNASAFADALERSENGDSSTFYVPDTVLDHAAQSLAVLDRIAQARSRNSELEDLIRVMASEITGVVSGPDDSLEVVRDVALDGLYEWIDEHIDSCNAILGLLIKYKQRSEWFGRERLRLLAEHGGERSLAIDLQQYVFDQGVEFTIEPSSSSGEADLVLRDTDSSHVILDAKYIPLGAVPSEFKRKLSHAFHQVARYCHDFNEPSGYVVVFLGDLKSPLLPLSVQDGFPFLEVKGKNVYYIPVAIADAPSASKSGRAEEVVVSLAELITTYAPNTDT